MYRYLNAGFSFLLVCSLFSAPVAAQAPVTELRGAWIATVANIDWPSKPGLSPDRQRVEFDSLLDVLKAMGMNAVFVQIRPAGDAFYPSATVPWSKYLTGKQGRAPEPMYDPLEYMIGAAHKRRIEFHAWLNPYRATFDLDTANLAPSHPLRALPNSRKGEWFFRYGKKYYFNPANPLVIQHLNNVVKDLVVRYDLDGIHFDDYFYPYKEQGEQLTDYNAFAADPRGFKTVEDWRRDNVDRLVKSVSATIKGIKPYMRFGVGTFGVWRNADVDPERGSDTRSGLTCYDDLYADVLKWLRNGWIDYVAPQLYWSIGFPAADYQKLVDWWGRNTFGKNLYIGHAAYKVGTDPRDPNWKVPDQISRQVAMNRANPNVKGSIYYSARPLLNNQLGLRDTLIKALYPTPSVVPSVPNNARAVTATPQICRTLGTRSSIKLAWHACEISVGEETPFYFAIYRFEGKGIGDFQDARNLIMITPFYTEKWIFEDQRTQEGLYYTYVIVAYNRYNVASYSSDPIVIQKTRTGAVKRRVRR